MQAFTAIGTIETGEIYQVQMSAEFSPFRVDVKYFKCHETPIRPLIEKLSFIKTKSRWGAAFRFGLVKIPKEDFECIANAMGVPGLYSD